MALDYKATVELKDCKVTFEGPREFVEEQVARWAREAASKQLGVSDSNVSDESPSHRDITERDLVAAKRPSGHLETVAVIAFALTQSGMDEFSEDDVRRAYLLAGVRPPKVVAQALRDAKNRMDYIEPGSKRGFYRLSPHGDRTVRFDLPRS
jgi:hypothetical protein